MMEWTRKALGVETALEGLSLSAPPLLLRPEALEASP